MATHNKKKIKKTTAKRKKLVKRKLKSARSSKSAKKTKSKKKMKRSKKSKRTVVKGKKMAVAKAAKIAKQKLIGKVVHYYDKIGVAIVDLQSPLKLGDTVRMKRGDLEWTEPVNSLQIEHMPVPQAKKGDIVGMKVGIEVREGTLVMPG